jgi:hypothetical protein
MTWRFVIPNGNEPPNRTSHAAVTYNNSMYIFAGYSGEKYLNDLHKFDFGIFQHSQFFSHFFKNKKGGSILHKGCLGKYHVPEVVSVRLFMETLCIFWGDGIKSRIFKTCML